ncbi:MAG: T9SS type A sorting domain-containing protein [Flavobacteriales bacterium]|nr:T9SS type A sorting domain-containing protein [Flavobacteriales bacterium]
MKKIYLFSLFALFAMFANAQVSGVSIQLYYSDDGTVDGYPEGFNTWRVYVHFESADDYLSAVYASTESVPLTIGSSTDQIWNSALGGITRDDITDAMISVAPVVEYDSYVAVGATSTGNEVSFISSQPAFNLIDDAFGAGSTDELDENLYMVDGIWFNLPYDDDSFASGNDNSVLIAQITTDGDVEVCVNFQVFPGGQSGSLTIYDDYCETAQAPVSVEEVSAQGQMVIFPNPAQTTTQITVPSNGQFVQISDLSGRLVSQYRVVGSTQSVDLADFTDGLYFVRVFDQAGQVIETQKLILE